MEKICKECGGSLSVKSVHGITELVCEKCGLVHDETQITEVSFFPVFRKEESNLNSYNKKKFKISKMTEHAIKDLYQMSDLDMKIEACFNYYSLFTESREKRNRIKAEIKKFIRENKEGGHYLLLGVLLIILERNREFKEFNRIIENDNARNEYDKAIHKFILKKTPKSRLDTTISHLQYYRSTIEFDYERARDFYFIYHNLFSKLSFEFRALATIILSENINDQKERNALLREHMINVTVAKRTLERISKEVKQYGKKN